MNNDIDDVVAVLQAKWGKRALRRGTPPNDLYTHQLSTGTVALDDGLGGGWQWGESYTLSGYGSSGASTLAYRTLVTAQAESCWPLWIDMSRTFDPCRAHHLGVDVERLTVVRPASLTELGRLLHDLLPLGGLIIAHIAPEEKGPLPEPLRQTRRHVAPSGLLLWLCPLLTHAVDLPPTTYRLTCRRMPDATSLPATWQSQITVQRYDRTLATVTVAFDSP
ncbi:MAG: hypothetical protein KDD73_17370 [Anaerolineales bacterium]|nr:hypothetical protein [Anaerolineales bacterium]